MDMNFYSLVLKKFSGVGRLAFAQYDYLIRD